ncbi:ribonuclease inhibitor [Stenotrophomonas sp. AB1(2024)]|uniref:ribonuclease inhibitor n=1 Tax=Stenotrophomonas sp. AB1(2024) TaxID=3132215 RepID=UPI0038FBB6E4
MTKQDPLVLVLEGGAVRYIPSFYAEINRLFMADADWQLGHSLDALNDMLYGGYGVLAGHAGATLIWRDIEYSRNALGVETTRAWLQAKLDGNERFNRPLIAGQLQALDAGKGPTFFQVVMDIFAAHAQITLVCN